MRKRFQTWLLYLCLVVPIAITSQVVKSQAPQTANQLITQGQAAQTQGNTADAVRLFNEAQGLALRERNAPALLQLSHIMLELRKFTDTRQNYEYSYTTAYDHAVYNPDIKNSGDDCGGVQDLQNLVGFFDGDVTTAIGTSTDPDAKSNFNIMRGVRDNAEVAAGKGCFPVPAPSPTPAPASAGSTPTTTSAGPSPAPTGPTTQVPPSNPPSGFCGNYGQCDSFAGVCCDPCNPSDCIPYTPPGGTTNCGTPQHDPATGMMCDACGVCV